MVRLEGIETPCLLLLPHADLPEQFEISFDGSAHAEIPKTGSKTYRLEPSSSHDAEPSYRELFDE